MRGRGGFSAFLFLLVILAFFKATPVWASANGVIDPDNTSEFIIEGSGTEKFRGDPPLLGHNLTPTSYTLPSGEVSAGSYALVIGLTDNWTLGTSPWLAVQYNMPSIISRVGADTGSEVFQRMALELNYFKTLPYLFNTYDQESVMARFTATHRFDSSYTLHLTGGYQYFINDNRPFSLRMISNSTDLSTISLSSLHEIHFDSRAGMMFEAGILGVNYPIPYYHLGLSFFKRWKGGFIQLGISRTALLQDVASRLDGSYSYSDWSYITDSSARIGERVYEKVDAVHPEIQLQFEI